MLGVMFASAYSCVALLSVTNAWIELYGHYDNFCITDYARLDSDFRDVPVRRSI